MDFAEALKAGIVKNQRSKPRDIGKIYASAVGHPCDRKLWYDCHEPKQEIFTIESLLRMDSGNRAEQGMMEYIKKMDDLSILSTQFPIHIGSISGKLDGIFVWKNESYVWEHKEVSEDKFDKLTNDLLNWNETYYAQIQTYMEGTDIKKCLFTVSANGIRDIKAIIVEHDAIYVQKIKDRSIMITEAADPLPRLDDWQKKIYCKNCVYNNKCW